MNNCIHQFFEIKKKKKADSIYKGVVVVCAYCGHMRILWEDGTIEIIKESGQIKRHESI